MALPGDGDVGVNAQGSGEDRGGGLGGGVEQRGAAVLAGADPEVVEPFGQLRTADRLTGLTSGEQPGRGCQGSNGRVALAVGHDGAREGGGRLGQVDGHASEAEVDFVWAGLYLRGGHAA